MRFTKMQGAGNDFIVLNNRALKLPVSAFPDLARRLCARRVSLGANALMVADFPTGDGDLRMRFYNADGSEGEMCGNGARCLARYAWESGTAAGETIRIETVAGLVLAWRVSRREYKIKLNDPSVLDLDRARGGPGRDLALRLRGAGRPGPPSRGGAHPRPRRQDGGRAAAPGGGAPVPPGLPQGGQCELLRRGARRVRPGADL